MTKPLRWIAVTISAINLLITSAVWAAVERIEIVERDPFAEGAEFGSTGAYERLKGRLHFAVDPNEPANRAVVDLKLAPRDGRGLVTFSADFILLRPADLSRGNHTVLYEVNNRGNLGMLSMFNGARHSNDPLTLADTGDGFLLRQGYSLLWSAWNWDVRPGNDRLQIELPIASEAGRTITGPLAAEFVVNRPTVNAPFMWGFSRGYPPLSLDDPKARLTVRDEPDGERTEIARDAWRFARWEGGLLIPDPTLVFYDQGFVPGRIYEVVYTARDPRVVGLGLAAIRDAISFFRFAGADAEGTVNPLANAANQIQRRR